MYESKVPRLQYGCHFFYLTAFVTEFIDSPHHSKCAYKKRCRHLWDDVVSSGF